MLRLTVRRQSHSLPPRPAILVALLALNACAEDTISREPNVQETYHPASVAGNVMTLSSVPDFHLRIGSEFADLGSTSFLLGGVAQTDIFFFAVASGDSIERFLKVQVESLVEDAARDYRWEGEDTVRVAGGDYFRGFWCLDAAEMVRERPEGDIALTQAWLTANGYSRTGAFIGTRLARVFNGGRSELLLFYGESTRLTGVGCDDEETAMKHLPSIVARSDSAFRLGGGASTPRTTAGPVSAVGRGG